MADGEEINVDELMTSIEAPSAERPMTGGETEAPAPEQTPTPTWDGKPWEFESNGKKIVPDSQDKAKIWMSQGYNYSQRMGELNRTHAQRMAEAEQRAKAAGELEKRFSSYAKVDDYARANPQWWQTIEQQFSQAQQKAQGIDPNLATLIKPLEEKLGKFEQYFGQIQQQQAVEEEKHYDQLLDQQIESIRKDNPNIDLNSKDPGTGETLQLRILKHAQSIGTNSFKAAFWDYLGPKLIEQAKASGREAIAKDTQLAAKKGILGKTPVPAKGVQMAQNVRGKSYDQLAREALAEFGIS